MNETFALKAARRPSLDPRAVLVSSFLLLLSVKGLHHLRSLVGTQVLVLLLVGLLGVSWKEFFKRALWALPFCSAALPLLLTTPGPRVSILPQCPAVSSEGLHLVSLIVGQTLLCFQLMILAAVVASPTELVGALGRLGCPRVVVSVLTLCLRYGEVIADELRRLQTARCSRAYREPGLLFRARLTGQLVGVLFLRTWSRAERVQQAMQSRGGACAAALDSHSHSSGPWGWRDWSLVVLSLSAVWGCWGL